MNVRLQTFNDSSAEVIADFDHRVWMQAALKGYEHTRAKTQAQYGDWQAARRAAADIKWDAIENVDKHIERFIAGLESRGTQVFAAAGAADARQYILDVVRRHNARSVVKSKCMTSEEIELNELLESEGFEVVESDLGEFIVQLLREPPYHFVFPAMHLKRDRISRVFQERLGAEQTDDPEELTYIARRALREKYVAADIGFTGANFGIAETGMVSITENEGNARLTMALPKVHIVLMGIEKILPKMSDLALFLPMLAAAGTGQMLTGYNTLIGGPRQPGETDGPGELHVVLLDNRRSEMLADRDRRDALRCIRCGACLNVCPVFKNVGGHSYGTTYQGPIGAVITPDLRGMPEWKHLWYASSLCGACTETCPVEIDLHRHLLAGRARAMRAAAPFTERLMFGGFAFVMRRPGLYRFASKVGRLLHKLWSPLQGTWLDPLRAWRSTREFPEPARQSFRDYWKAREQ